MEIIHYVKNNKLWILFFLNGYCYYFFMVIILLWIICFVMYYYNNKLSSFILYKFAKHCMQIFAECSITK